LEVSIKDALCVRYIERICNIGLLNINDVICKTQRGKIYYAVSVEDT
jgi:hypothetical protein